MEEQPEYRQVLLEDIASIRELQIRFVVNEGVVDLYAARLADGHIPPPITLVAESSTGQLLLADGWHRVAAARRAGLQEIAAEIYKGTRADVLLLACQYNMHGPLSLSPSDCRRAVNALLHDPDIWKQSNREIARLTGMAETDVDSLRDRFYSEAVEYPRNRHLKRGSPHTPPATLKILDHNPLTDSMFEFGGTEPSTKSFRPQTSQNNRKNNRLGRGPNTPPAQESRMYTNRSRPLQASDITITWMANDGSERMCQLTDVTNAPQDVQQALWQMMLAVDVASRQSTESDDDA